MDAIAAVSFASAMAFQPPMISRFVGVGLRGRVGHPDLRVRSGAQLGDILDDPDDTEPLAVGFQRLPDRRPPAEEPLARAGVDDRDEPRFGDVGGSVRAPFEKREVQDPPELVIGPFEH